MAAWCQKIRVSLQFCIRLIESILVFLDSLTCMFWSFLAPNTLLRYTAINREFTFAPISSFVQISKRNIYGRKPMSQNSFKRLQESRVTLACLWLKASAVKKLAARWPCVRPQLTHCNW